MHLKNETKGVLVACLASEYHSIEAASPGNSTYICPPHLFWQNSNPKAKIGRLVYCAVGWHVLWVSLNGGELLSDLAERDGVTFPECKPRKHPPCIHSLSPSMHSVWPWPSTGLDTEDKKVRKQHLCLNIAHSTGQETPGAGVSSHKPGNGGMKVESPRIHMSWKIGISESYPIGKWTDIRPIKAKITSCTKAQRSEIVGYM